MIKPKPSIPKTTLILIELNHEFDSRNWNCVLDASKKKRSATLALRIKRDQKSEKLRIKAIFVLSVSNKTKQPTKGKRIRLNNIENNNKSVVGLEPITQNVKFWILAN
jgi:hypothetical protein